ncbi:MAG: alpha/beta hydrolase family protein [Solirubrobacterales bacterium]
MWESLATTRRQDRVLHGFSKFLNVLIGIVALPVWLIAQRAGGPLRRMLERRGAAPRELPVPPKRERSMAALMADLETLPSRLRSSPWAEPRKGLADMSTFVLSQNHDLANYGYAYPRQFHELTFDAGDGIRIAASVAFHDVPRPALIVVHGLFTTRRFDYVREPAVRAFFNWGFNVAAVDLRSFGLTGLMNEAPSSGGWKEGEDLLAVARELKRMGATSVGALGISLGASSVLGASHPEGADVALDGGILAVSPPADVAHATERLSRDLPLNHPGYALNYGFRAMLLSRVRGSRWPDVTLLSEALDQVSAAYYGLDVEEIHRRSSAVKHIAKARVPVLVLHPEDDHVIPVSHAEMLAEAAAGNDLVRVWTLPGGGHGALDAVDRRWTYSVYRHFFERWAAYPDRESGEVVYSRPSSGKLGVSG